MLLMKIKNIFHGANKIKYLYYSIMSGQPCKTPSDAQKYRDAYMANLNLQIKNDDKNFQANKLHQRTGVVATQISDYRSTSEKLADVEMLRALVQKELLQICDSINCQAIVQK